MFRLDRVLGVEFRDEHFERPRDFAILPFVIRALATTPGRWQVDVLLHTTLEYAQCYVSPSMATLEEVGDGVVLRCAVQDLNWLAHRLVGLRVPLVVREPPELRQAMRNLAAEVAALAEME